jgi:hypothetical protein
MTTRSLSWPRRTLVVLLLMITPLIGTTAAVTLANTGPTAEQPAKPAANAPDGEKVPWYAWLADDVRDERRPFEAVGP